MHPDLMKELACQRAAELRTQAHEGRPHMSRRGPRASVRHRAGWALVEAGLRLARESDPV